MGYMINTNKKKRRDKYEQISGLVYLCGKKLIKQAMWMAFGLGVNQ